MENEINIFADDPTPTALLLSSAERFAPDLAPPGYRPHLANGPVVYDDELAQAAEAFSPAWRRFFAGGSNRLHYVLFDEIGTPHFVEQSGIDGTYQVSGPDYDDEYENAYDAFWKAEVQSGVFTNPEYQAN